MKQKRFGLRKTLSMALSTGMLLSAVPFTSAMAASGVAIDETNFPDYSFRSYVKNEFDSDGNEFLSANEIKNATDIAIGRSSVHSLKGIDF